jgi:hypothetical protein
MLNNLEENKLDLDVINFEIEAIFEETIALYFTSLNAQNFLITASLFAEDGVMYPPFEEAIIGKEAIANYLEKEAKGMKFFPGDRVEQIQVTENFEYQVLGKVETPLFGVNVGWTFVLNTNAKIVSVKIKLLAKLEELLKLKVA